MIKVKLTERERDFLDSILEYFMERGGTQPYVITRKQKKFRDEEMVKLMEKIK